MRSRPRPLVAVSTLASLALGPIALAGCFEDVDRPDGDAAAAPAAVDGAAPCRPEWQRGLDAWGAAGFSGTIVVTTAGATDCALSYGLADDESARPNDAATAYRIGSVSKAFTAAAVAELVARGTLRLDDRVGDHLPTLRGAAADATIEQLLLHTSGLTGSHGEDRAPLGADEAIAAIGRLGLAFPPGTDDAYSNAGYTLLALVVDATSGAGYRAFLSSEILQGGGFTDDGLGDRYWATAGNGDLEMTMPDLAAWTRALHTGELLSAAATAVLVSTTYDHGDGTREHPGWVALDAAAVGTPVLAAAGGGGDSGHQVVVAWAPDADRVVAVASTTDRITAEELLEAVGPSVVAGDPVPPPAGATPGPVDPEVLAAVEGSYRLDDGGSLDVRADGDELLVVAAGPAAIAALRPVPPSVEPGEVAGHEGRVLTLLRGETGPGRDELALLEADLGPIVDVELLGTVFEDGELRTYVLLHGDGGDGDGDGDGDEPVPAWYAVDDHGAVAAAELVDHGPALRLRPSGPGTFRPVDPAGTGPDLTVGFGDGVLTIRGPDGTTTTAGLIAGASGS